MDVIGGLRVEGICYAANSPDTRDNKQWDATLP